MKQAAEPDHPILDVMRERWSPRAFDPRPVPAGDLRKVFEAARWAASAFNEQPWRFIVARREDQTGFNRMLDCLMEGNQVWARNAGALVLTASSSQFRKNGKENRCALHDLGQASAHLVLQATSMGLFAHQMAGVHRDRVRTTYGVPQDFEPQTAIAIGYLGAIDSLTDPLREMESQPRTRAAQSDFVFGGSWGHGTDW